jgi:signal transduction histidine kinase/HAMP domain-containing protein
MRAVTQATEAMLEDRLTTASLVADYLDEALGRALTELQNTAHMIEIDGAQDSLEAPIEALEDTYSRLSVHTHSIYLLNEGAQIIWSQPADLDIADVDMSAYPSIAQALGKDEPTISGLVSSPLTNAPVILLTSPTREGAAGSQGVLIVAVDLTQSSISGFVQPIRLGQTGYVEIVDQEGIVVTRTEPGPTLAPFEKSDHSGRFAALISAGEPTRGVCHTCHETEQKVERKDVLAFIPLSNAQWGVVIRQSEEEALAPARELRRNLILFGVGLVTVALLFVTVTTRDVGRRIRMLTTASHRIAEGDLISPVTTPGKDEVGILGQTLDTMRTRLKTSYGELEQRTKELTSLLSVSEILTSPRELSRLLDAVVTKAVEIISGADAGALLLQSADGDGVSVQSAIGLDKVPLPQRAFVPGSKPPSDSISVTVEDAGKDIIEEAVTAFLQSDAFRSGLQSFICAEVVHRSQHTGSLIMVSYRDSKAFSESDHRLLQSVADYVAIAIERAQLTKETEAAQALYEADRLRSQFISSVSHELRTPLTLIKGYSTSLLRQDVSWGEESQREFLQIIDEKTDELRDLIDKLLQSAKLEAGALQLEKEPVLLARLAHRVVEEIASRARRHEFTLDFPPSFPVVEADIRYMEQALRNLVENAVKYSPEGGKVAMTGEVKDGKLVVSVSDEGIGIPPEHQDKVFERFYRVDSASTRNTPGSGLGLSITKGHIEAHGGEVWVESTAGKGSKFHFSLPLDQGENGKHESE